MNTASLELCKELYELSAWLKGEWVEFRWVKDTDGTISVYNNTEWSDYTGGGEEEICPAYDLGYLLRKLPHEIPANGEGRPCVLHIEPDWFAGYVLDNDYVEASSVDDDSAENAVCKLAIELFKQGVLKNES